MADPESYNAAVLEIRRLRQGIWDMATQAGMDTDGDTTSDAIRGDIVELGLEEVRELREVYDEAGQENERLRKMLRRIQRDAVHERSQNHPTAALRVIHGLARVALEGEAENDGR